jgi:hypothetical protein
LLRTAFCCLKSWNSPKELYDKTEQKRNGGVLASERRRRRKTVYLVVLLERGIHAT